MAWLESIIPGSGLGNEPEKELDGELANFPPDSVERRDRVIGVAARSISLSSFLNSSPC
jgi:hypothetical protein